MSVSFSKLRQAIASKIETITGMKESKFPVQYIEKSQDSVIHKSFSVGFETVREGGISQRRGQEIFVQSSITIIFCYRLRPKDIYPSDYDNSLDLERQIIETLLSNYGTIRNEISVQFDSSNRVINDTLEYQITTLNFIAHHNIKS